MAIASCRQVLQPDEIQLHLGELPFGFYWDMTRPLVTVKRIEPVPEVSARPHHPEIRPYLYAHHADVIRLNVLADVGGMYADIDTLFLRPVPDEWWSYETVIGREAPVTYSDSVQPEESVSNALMMAHPDSRFIDRWRDRIMDAMDGTWSGHSCRLATRLARDHPEWVRVEPQSSFSPVEHTPDGIRLLLEGAIQP
jgi:hypothetical protein